MQDIDAARFEGLTLAVELHAARDRERDPFDPRTLPDRVIDTAGQFAGWLLARPASIRVGNPVITRQGSSAPPVPAVRSGADMAVTMKDTDNADYPAPEALDTKGFEVTDTITLTTDDTAGAIVTQTNNPDGSTRLAGVAPGAVQVTWSDGTLSFVDTLNVTAGDAAQIVVGPPVITSQV